MWPTPIHRDWKDGDARTQNVPTNNYLGREASRWSTPKSSPSGPDYARAGREGSGGEDLVTQTCLLSHPDPETPPRGNGFSIDGQNSLLLWPTPNAIEGHGVGAMGEAGGSSNIFRGTEMANRKLNPRFVEHLMGFPLGWTVLEHSETEWSRWLRRMRSVLSLVEQGA
jgi:hypothetical protein